MALQRAVYRPRDAEHTVLHQVIALHLEAFLGEAVWRWPATARVCRSSSRAPRGRTTRRRALMLAILRKMRTTSPVVSHSPGVMAGESTRRHLDLDVGRRLFAGLLVDPRRHDGFRRRNPEPDGRRKRDDPCIHTTQDTRHSNEADCRCDATCSWPHGDVRVLQRADSPR